MKHKYIAKKHWNTVMAPLSKTNDMVLRYDDVIDLSIGDPDYPADRQSIEYMYAEGLKGHTRYTPFLGDMDLRKATANMYRQDYGFEADPEEILITNGGTHALFLALSAILDVGDEVIAMAPYYLYYGTQIDLAGGKLVVYNTKGEENFDINPEELEKHITARTKAIIINSPNNPSGKVYSYDNMKDLYQIAEKYDLLVIADDIYGALNYTDDNRPMCTMEDSPNRVITVYTYSKDFSFTGLRLGHVIAGKELIETMRDVNEAVSFTVNSMSQRCGINLIERRHEIQGRLREEYAKRLMYVYDRVQNIGNMSCNYPEGTFYLFINVKDTGIDDFELWERILDEAHVLVLPGGAFGEAGSGYIRIACTVGIDALREAFDRLEKMEIFS